LEAATRPEERRRDNQPGKRLERGATRGDVTSTRQRCLENEERASFEVSQVYEHLWMSTYHSVFGAPKNCVEPTQKKRSHIWVVANHKSQVCD